MKIGLQTWGSHGDIRPFMALAAGLQAAGHDATLVATCVDSGRYSRLLSGTSFDFKVVATPVIPDRRSLEKIGSAIIRERNAVKQTQMVIEQMVLPAESEMFEASLQLCAENDLVVGHYFLHTLGAAADHYARPHVSIALADGAVPSAFQPPSGVPQLGTAGNRIAWRLARFVGNRQIKKYSDRLRVKNGIKKARDLFDNVWGSEYLTLLAVSPTLCRRQPDWPGRYQICGFLDTSGSVAESAVGEDLQAFLAEGTPPAYMTFGSVMSGSDEKETIAMFTNAAQAATVRAIIQAPHWRDLGFESSRTIHYVDAVPHSTVFPCCSLILHHGGAGTSQSALRAGKPSVVVAHTAEQELWGRELERVGVAPQLIRRTRATADRITGAIKHVVCSDRIAGNARKLGAAMSKEDGVATAIKLICDRFET